jgi:hypothetical protein
MPEKTGKTGGDEMRDIAALKENLARVNAEWRDLARQSGSEAKLSRMIELRTERLTLMTDLFELESRQRKAG